MNLAFDLSEEQILRFSAARVMARLKTGMIFLTVQTYGSLNVAEPTGERRNRYPEKPQIADQFDLSWEWYFDVSSLACCHLLP